MLRKFGQMYSRAASRVVLAFLLAFSPATPSLWAHPEKGAPAPPLDSLQLLQAPLGAKADWASLKGKVVVLEFWATWCSPCVASLPHFNQLVEALDPAKFQFISVDDEDVQAIRTFLSKKKMAGWVGIDGAGGIFSGYGINSRPTTVVIDGSGRMVAVTEIDSLSAADLRAVAEGKNVAFKPAYSIVEATGASAPDASAHPLFAVSLSEAKADAKSSQVNHPPTGTDFLGVDADGLLTDAFDVFGNRYVLNGPLPQGRYDLRVNFVDAPRAATAAVVQQAVLSGLHLQIQPKTVTKPAYILRATDASSKLLSPSASTHVVKRGYWHGIYILMNGTMDDLAYILATGLQNPVVNQTEIAGAFDARFKVAAGDVDTLNTVLRETLGLELVPGNREMSITVLEVSKQEDRKLAPPAETPEVKR